MPGSVCSGEKRTHRFKQINGTSGGKRILENTFNKRLNSVCEELHITPKSTHKIRRTYGTTLIDNSVNESTIAEQMGHSDISVMKNYYYYSNKSKSTKLKQLDKAINF